MKKARITIAENGPYLVEGGVPLANQHIVTNAEGESLEWREGEALPHEEEYALCRCGQSEAKPFCDGTHKRVRFSGAETASRKPYETQAGRIDGPTMVLGVARACAHSHASAILTVGSGTSLGRPIGPKHRNWSCRRPATALVGAWSQRIERRERRSNPTSSPRSVSCRTLRRRSAVQSGCGERFR